MMPLLTTEQKEACGYLAHHVLSGEGLTSAHARVLLALLADFERERKAMVKGIADVARCYDTEYDGRTYTYCTGCGCCTSDGEEHDPTCIWPSIPEPPPFDPGSDSVRTVPCPDCKRKFVTNDDMLRHHRDRHP